MNKIFSLCFIIVFTSILNISAQNGFVVRGKVTDAETGEPVIGANIIEYDQQKRIIKGTITDVNGYYVLNATNENSLIGFSSIGYKTKEFNLDGRSTLDVELEPESVELEEVMVVGRSEVDPLTGVSDRNKASSRVKVDMAESRSIGAISAGDALQGKVSGMDITSVSGNPGSGSSIVIRGLGSLGNSEPLIVVDGIKQNINIESDFSFASADQEDLGNLVNIAPQDIKSVEVLKDAASTAVWGSEGADGVLLIETFKGQKGKTQFTYNSKLTRDVQPPAIPMLNGDEYIMMQLEEWHNARGIFDLPPEIAYDRDYVDFYNYSANTNWLEEITQKGYQNEQFFKLEGGGDKTLYYASVSYLGSEGTTVNTSFDRITTRVNLDYNISDKLRFTTQFNYTNSVKGDNFVDNRPGGRDDNVRKMSYKKAPNMSVWEYDNQGNPTGEYFTPIETYQGSGVEYYNPVAITDLSENDIEKNSLENSFILTYNIFTWLRFKETLSFTYLNQKNNWFLPYNAVGADWLDPHKNDSRERNLNSNKIMTRSQLFFTPRINTNHVFSSVLMWETDQQELERSSLYNNRGPSVNISDPAANTQLNNIRSYSQETRTFGALLSLNYTIMDKYIAQFNLRADGSSKFGESQRWGYFPSISAGWRFANEVWFEAMDFMNEGKLRVSYGQAGKQPNGAYVRHAIYNTVYPYQYIENPIIVPLQVQLANLKWQTVSSWNVGVDLGFFEERLTATAEMYDKITSDLLWEGGDRYQIPSSSGYDYLRAYNAGKVRNKGWEFYTNANIIQRSDLFLSVNFNISRNINTFIEFPENFENEKDIDVRNGDFPRRADEGVPVGSFYGFRYLGVWPSDDEVVSTDANGKPLLDAKGNPVPLSHKEEYEFEGGDAKYYDVNHDGKIDILDAIYLGDSNPDFIGGFGFNFGWKNFDLSSQFFFRTGYQIVNEVALNTEGMLNKDNQSKAVLRRWRKQGMDEENLLPRAYLFHPANNLGSDRYVEDGDFLRLNNLTLSYRLDKDFVQRFGLNTFQVSLNMRKIATFTNYTGQDPEVSQSGSDPFWFGTDNARTPPSRSYTLSVNVRF